jgi:hypothetical protein
MAISLLIEPLEHVRKQHPCDNTEYEQTADERL